MFTDGPVIAMAVALAPGTTYQEHSVAVQPQRNEAQLASPLHTSYFLSILSLGTCVSDKVLISHSREEGKLRGVLS